MPMLLGSRLCLHGYLVNSPIVPVLGWLMLGPADIHYPRNFVHPGYCVALSLSMIFGEHQHAM